MANQYKNKIIYGGDVLIDLTSDTVSADKLAYGITAHDKSGAPITGTNTYDADTSDATAVASEILATKTAYANGSKLVQLAPKRSSIQFLRVIMTVPVRSVSAPQSRLRLLLLTFGRELLFLALKVA